MLPVRARAGSWALLDGIEETIEFLEEEEGEPSDRELHYILHGGCFDLVSNFRGSG